jgi:hypothetical protein
MQDAAIWFEPYQRVENNIAKHIKAQAKVFSMSFDKHAKYEVQRGG